MYYLRAGGSKKTFILLFLNIRQSLMIFIFDVEVLVEFTFDHPNLFLPIDENRNPFEMISINHLIDHLVFISPTCVKCLSH